MNQIRKIFEPDELELVRVQEDWTPEVLLAQEGIIFLKDVVKILDLDPQTVKRKANEIRARNDSPWKKMGLRKMWRHWAIRMKVFAPFYLENLVSKVHRIEKHWDGNTLLKQIGVFYLTEVCILIPFTTFQLRYRAKQNPKSREQYGIWKDEEPGKYLVDMEKFAPWISKLWEGRDR